MSEPESAPGPLSELAALFESCALWALRAALESEPAVKTPFEYLSAVPAGASLYCILPAAGARHYAQLVVGVDEKDLALLLPAEPDEARRKRAIGALANAVSGLFLGHERFRARFGVLKPSTPFFSEGAFTARKDGGLRGSAEVRGREILLQFTLRELDGEGGSEGPGPGRGIAEIKLG